MEGKLVELEVRVHGKAVREFRHKGITWIEGRKGSDFVLRVRNRVHRRILAVVSVDGRSVMDGEPASRHSSGYVIGAGGYMDIPGWRLDDEQIAKFFFGAFGKGYAESKGAPANVGVIGLATFLEKLPDACKLLRGVNICNVSTPIGHSHTTFTHQAPPVTNTGASSHSQLDSMITCSVGGDEGTEWRMSEGMTPQKPKVQQDISTGFGDVADHAVTYTSFEKASSRPDETMEIRYDSRRNLKKRGVPMGKRRATVAEPDPFPGDRGCKPPPGWDGRR